MRVGLVEAGGPARHPLLSQPDKWPLLQNSEVDWAYRTIPQRHTANRVHEWARGRVLGGSTAINAMAHVRGHASDFDRWASAGCTGWGYARPAALFHPQRDLCARVLRLFTAAAAPSI